jgi:hypothetical protein
MNADMQIVKICQEYKWTYQDYISQPVWFIQLIKEKMVRDDKAKEMEERKQRHG